MLSCLRKKNMVISDNSSPESGAEITPNETPLSGESFNSNTHSSLRNCPEYNSKVSFPNLQQIHVRKIERGEKVDYFEILKDDVRNMRPLTKPKVEYIKNLGKSDLIELIQILDAVNKTIISVAGLREDY